MYFLLSITLLTACIEITDPEEEAAKQEAIEREAAEKKEKEEAAQKAADEKKNKEDKIAAEKEAQEKEKYTYTESDENQLRDAFEWYMEEQDYVITAIEPLNDDNYDVIYVYVVDEIKLLNEEEKQYLVDDWGASIINQTNAVLYGGFTDNPPMVHFKYQDGSKLADEKIFGGWEIK